MGFKQYFVCGSTVAVMICFSLFSAIEDQLKQHSIEVNILFIHFNWLMHVAVFGNINSFVYLFIYVHSKINTV